MSSDTATFYVTGGTLGANAPCYVERQADKDLHEALLESEFSYVLTSRQMGKSSLMARAAVRWRLRSVQVVMLDLTAVGQNLSPEQWFDGLVMSVGRQLGLEDEFDAFWMNHPRLGPCQRFFAGLREVALAHGDPGQGSETSGHPASARSEESGKVIIFVDEIDVVRSLPFAADEFFAAIRECYNRRIQDPAWNRLTFCLLGVASPTDLIRNPRTTPFNIGRRIELTDFTPEEAAGLAGGLTGNAPLASGLDQFPPGKVAGQAVPRLAGEMLSRILYWTNGHPYLTQRLCRAAAEALPNEDPTTAAVGGADRVDRLCEVIFLSPRARERDDNLLFVREWLLRAHPDVAGVLRLYEQVWVRQQVADEENNPLIETLRLSGITRVEHGRLVLRNRIYRRVFDLQWIKAQLRICTHDETRVLAVLPFAELGHADTHADTHEYLADGITDELIQALGQVPGLRTVSRTSVFRYKGRSMDAREIGSELGADYVVEGTLRLTGAQLQIHVRLIKAADGQCTWSDTFRCSPDGMLNTEGDIARNLVSRLKLGLGGEVPEPALRTADIAAHAEAHNLYLKGRFLWNKRTETSVRRSIALFEEALTKHPDYALAHAGLADAYHILGTYGYALPRESYPKAAAAAQSAIELDHSLAQAYNALACTYAVHDWNWWRAETTFQRALQLNPSYATAHQWYAINCLTPLGRHEEALAELRRAQEMDPISLSLSATMGIALYYAGRFDEAIEQCQATIDLDSNFWLPHLFLGWAYLEACLPEKAVATLEQASILSQGDPVVLAAWGHTCGRAGRGAEARRALEQLDALSAKHYVPAIDAVFVHVGLSDWEGARRCLERAVEERSSRLIYARVDPKLAELRAQGILAGTLQQLGLAGNEGGQ